MNAFDFLFGDLKNRTAEDYKGNIVDSIIYDKEGNMTVNTTALDCEKCGVFRMLGTEVNWNELLISKEICERLKQYEVIVPENVNEYGYERKPHFRMRGKSVTQEQAFDIIRRTDRFFTHIDEFKLNNSSYIDTFNFSNSIFSKSSYPIGRGWVHPDGFIGINDIIPLKYPTLYEFIVEWLVYLVNFPYLNLVVAVTKWNEVSDEVWESMFKESSDKVYYDFQMDVENFCNAVIVGIYVHDKTVEILKPDDAVKKYKEYASLYEIEDKEIYIPKYHIKKGVNHGELPYLKKCIESYGLNADEELSKIQEYVWKGD